MTSERCVEIAVVGIDHRVTGSDRRVAFFRGDPDRRQPERGFARRDAVEGAAHGAGIDGKQAIDVQIAARHLDAFHQDRVGARAKLQVVRDVYRRHDQSGLVRDLPADRAHACEERAALRFVHDRDERVPDFDAEGIDGDGRFDRLWRRHARFHGFRDLAFLPVGVGRAAENRRDEQERELRQTGNDGQPDEHGGGHRERTRPREQLGRDFFAQVRLGRCACRDQAAGHRDEQRRNGRDESFADGQDGVGLEGGA